MCNLELDFFQLVLKQLCNLKLGFFQLLLKFVNFMFKSKLTIDRIHNWQQRQTFSIERRVLLFFYSFHITWWKHVLCKWYYSPILSSTKGDVNYNNGNLFSSNYKVSPTLNFQTWFCTLVNRNISLHLSPLHSQILLQTKYHHLIMIFLKIKIITNDIYT